MGPGWAARAAARARSKTIPRSLVERIGFGSRRAKKFKFGYCVILLPPRKMSRSNSSQTPSLYTFVKIRSSKVTLGARSRWMSAHGACQLTKTNCRSCSLKWLGKLTRGSTCLLELAAQIFFTSFLYELGSALRPVNLMSGIVLFSVRNEDGMREVYARRYVQSK